MNDVVISVFAIFTAVGNWFVEMIPTVLAVFYGAEGLTIIGVLALCSLGVAIILLVLNWVLDFFRFR